MGESRLPRRHRYRALLWCLVLSLAFHFLVVPLVVGLFGAHRPEEAVQETVYVARSSSLQLARRARPRPPSVTHPISHPHTQPVARPQPQQRQPPQQASRREIARIEPHARINVPRVSSTGVNVNEQQSLFEKTIAQLRRESDPVLGAARPVDTPAAPKRFNYDFSGSSSGSQAEGVLTPVKSWHDGPYDYYYVEYYVQYADGSTETGYVPWPLRYLPQIDPFLNHWQHFPLPVPLPDYHLPPGTNLHPLIAFCLEHQREVASCPIQHD